MQEVTFSADELDASVVTNPNRAHDISEMLLHHAARKFKALEEPERLKLEESMKPEEDETYSEAFLRVSKDFLETTMKSMRTFQTPAPSPTMALALEEHETKLTALADTLRDFLKTHSRLPERRETIIFDIDGTAINDSRSTWPEGTVYPPFTTILHLYEEVKAKGYFVVFITGRREATRAETERMLTAAGYTDWQSLIMYPNHLKHTVSALVGWKDSERKALEDHGVTLVACIGDQPMDVEGEHVGEFQVRLPEPPGLGWWGK